MGIIVWLLVGLIVGALAWLLVPGKDSMEWLGTLLVSLVGSLIGFTLGIVSFGREIDDVSAPGIVGSMFGAVIALLAHQTVKRSSRRRRRIWVFAVLAVMGVGVGVCVYDAELAAMRREPILEPPPGAIELARYEQESQSFLLPVEARVEVVLGLPGSVEEATRWYLDRYAEMYSLQPRLTGGWSGGRRVEPDFGVGASVFLYESLDAVEWTDDRLAEQAKASSWDGVVAIVGVS